MSSAEQNLTTRLRLLPVVLGIGAALLVTGCSAGQITQTDTQVPAINGSMGNVGPIAVRNVQLAFPTGKAYYAKGDDASLIVTIANAGESSDKLTTVTSPQFSSGGQIIGDATIGGHHAISATAGAARPLTTSAAATTTTTAAPTSTTGTSTAGTSTTGTSTTGGSSTSSSGTASTSTSLTTTTTGTTDANLPIGSIRILLSGLNVAKLQPGQTVQVTFTFATAGDVTLTVPIAADPSPRVDN